MQAVEDMAVQLSESTSETHSVISASASVAQRYDESHHNICGACQNSGIHVISTYEHDHYKRCEYRYGDRRYRVRIKYFQKFDIRCDYGYEVSLIPALKLCRTQSPQRCKYLVSDDRKQLKCYEMIAVLFNIVEYSTAHSDHHHDRHDPFYAVPLHDSNHCLSCKYGKENSTQITHCSEYYRRKHDVYERFYQPDQLSHDLYCTSPLRLFIFR